MIKILITEYNFEHDLYALVREFYPGEETEAEITELPEGAQPSVKILFDGEDEVDIPLPEAKSQADRFHLKNYVKRTVFSALTARTGKRPAWGTLTGIRPAKLALELMEEGRGEEEIRRIMSETYYCSDGKIHLCMEVAKREKRVLESFDYRSGYSLYIGIPFCPTRCLYCSFTSYPIEVWRPRVDEYLDALIRELAFISESMKDVRLDTIYMGGGTPTTLTPEQMDRLLNAIEKLFPFESLREITIEAGRPDSIDEAKLRVLRKHGIYRISINPQTMCQKTLDLIGRKHTVEDTRQAFYLARELGFTNINMDLIVGLPGEDIGDLRHTLDQIEELAPDSLTVHSLAIKRAARLNTMREQYKDYKVVNTPEMIDMTARSAKSMGLAPYYLYRQKNMAGNFENVGYAKVDKAGIYNILIMEEKQSIIAAGAGGSTKLSFPEENRIERIENVKDVGNYIARVDEMIERKGEWLCRLRRNR